MKHFWTAAIALVALALPSGAVAAPPHLGQEFCAPRDNSYPFPAGQIFCERIRETDAWAPSIHSPTATEYSRTHPYGRAPYLTWTIKTDADGTSRLAYTTWRFYSEYDKTWCPERGDGVTIQPGTGHPAFATDHAALYRECGMAWDPPAPTKPVAVAPTLKAAPIATCASVTYRLARASVTAQGVSCYAARTVIAKALKGKPTGYRCVKRFTCTKGAATVRAVVRRAR